MAKPREPWIQEAQLPKLQRCVHTIATAAHPLKLLLLPADHRLIRNLCRQDRAKASSGKASGGKLSASLEAQKKQTRSELLAAGSKAEQQARAADAATEARNYN